MSKKDTNKLKDIYDTILKDEDVKQKSQSSKQTFNFKQWFKKVVEFKKKNYLSLELMFMGFMLLCLGFVPAVKILSYQFLETLNVNVNFFDISGWIFSSNSLSVENVFLSLFSIFYILSSFAMIIIGILILLNILKKQQFVINSVMHLISCIVLMGFFITFACWVSMAKDVNLTAMGIDTIYYNFSTIKVYTLIYFNLSVVMLAYTATYIYHNRKNIFIKKK